MWSYFKNKFRNLEWNLKIKIIKKWNKYLNNSAKKTLKDKLNLDLIN